MRISRVDPRWERKKRPALRRARREIIPSGGARTARVIVWIHSDGAEAYSLSGSEPRSARKFLDTPLHTASIDEDRRNSAVDLVPGLLETLGVSPRARCLVIYDTKTAIAELSDAHPTALAAERAVRVSTAGRVDPALGISCDVRVVAPAAGPRGGWRAIGVAESTASVDGLSRAFEAAGVRVVGLVPCRGWALAAAVRAGTGREDDRPTAHLVLNRDSAGISAWAEGEPVFARPLEMGYGQLIAGLARGASRSSIRMDEVSETALGAAERGRDLVTRARRSLFSGGIPERDGPLAGFVGLRGRDVLPALQPVLQRLIIEVRQTLRFGTIEDGLAPRRLWLHGAGARIPGLADVLSDALDMPVAAASDDSEANAGPNAVSDVPPEIDDDAAATRVIVPAMVSTETKVRAARSRLRGLVVTGGCIAAAIAGIDAAMVFRDLGEVRAERRAIEPEIRRITAHGLAVSDTLRASEIVGGVTLGLDDAVRRLPVWPPMLRAIGEVAVPGWELVELSGSVDGRDAMIEITGLAETADGRSDSLRALIAALAGHPAFVDVRLGGTRIDEIDGRSYERFTVIVTSPAATAGRVAEIAAGETR